MPRVYRASTNIRNMGVALHGGDANGTVGPTAGKGMRACIATAGKPRSEMVQTWRRV